MFRLPRLKGLSAELPEAQRLRRTAGLLAAASLVLIVGLPIAMALFVAFADPETMATSFQLPSHIIQGQLQTWQRVACVAVIEIPVVMISLGIWEARKCFVAFAQGAIFTAPTVRSLRRFGAWMFASTLVSIAFTPAISMLLTAHNPPGAHWLTMRLDAEQLLMLPRVAMMWLLAAVIAQAVAGNEVEATNA